MRHRAALEFAMVLILTHRGTAVLASGDVDRRFLLKEAVARGCGSRVRIDLKAEGWFRPGLPPGKASAEVRLPKPLALNVQTRLVFSERVVEIGGDLKFRPENGSRPVGAAGPLAQRGPARKVVRHVIQAASAINGEIRPTSAELRPEVSLLVAEQRGPDGIVVVSPSGPLTRGELELVQTVGDPLALSDVLSAAPVELGHRWRVGTSAAQTLSGYDSITANGLDAVLESADGTKARVRVHGRIEGSALGGAGTMTCEGFLTFDRRLGWIDRLELNRKETRQPGPIEAGLDVKSTLMMTRHAEEPPATLSYAALAGVSLHVDPRRQRLLLVAPDRKSTLLHDRHWHTFWDDPKLIVLKRLEASQVVAQCNLAVGPPAGRGRHQDPIQFRDDVRRALKQRFEQFVGAGEVEGDPSGGFRYKVGVQGREGDLGVVWYYYLVASPGGDQLLVTFTLAQEHIRTFADQDLEMIGSIRWLIADR
jgi:hypothetical protein